jgi:hypothetical protein
MQQQAALRSLLQELRNLGIPDDKQLLASLLLKVPETGSPNLSAHTSSAEINSVAIDLEQLKPKEIQALARSLNRESAGFVAKVLHLQEWSWEQALLNQLTLSQEQRVRARLHALKRETAHVFESSAPLTLEKTVRQALITAIQESRNHEENVNTSTSSLWRYWRTISTRIRNFARNRIDINVGRAA